MPVSGILEVRDIHAGYRSVPILHGVTLNVRQREIVAIIGRNGVGKSTLMKCLIGLLRCTTGQIVFNGQMVTNEPANKRATKGMAYIPQGRGLFPRITVRENLLVGEVASRDALDERYRMVHELFPILIERAHQRAGTLSGGEQQMLAIARALISGPDLVLLDEPSEGVQPSLVRAIGERMCEINQQLGTAIILVEQNVDIIRAMAQRCYVIDKGCIVDELEPSSLSDPALLRRYLAV